ncbi:MAG: hypothetical protein ACRDBL_08210 [Rhabdaerophilum sp.]
MRDMMISFFNDKHMRKYEFVLRESLGYRKAHSRERPRIRDDGTMRNFGISIVFSAALVAPAYAWTPPSVGMPCRAPARSVEVNLVAGNYLGGRVQKHGIVDRKSFQACFRDIASCENWLAKRAGAFPLQPGIATCVPVRIGGRS